MKDMCGIEGHGHCMVLSMKLAVVSFVFILINLWSGLANWVINTNVWWFVLAFVIFAIKPMMSGCCGHKGQEVVEPTAVKPKAKKRKKAKKK